MSPHSHWQSFLWFWWTSHFVHFLMRLRLLRRHPRKTSPPKVWIYQYQCWTGHRWWISFQIRMQKRLLAPFLLWSPVTWLAKSHSFLDTGWSLKILRKDYAWGFTFKGGKAHSRTSYTFKSSKRTPTIFPWLLRLEKRLKKNI